MNDDLLHQTMTRTELTVFLERIASLETEMSAKERWFLREIIKSGLAAAEVEEVQGYAVGQTGAGEVYFPISWAPQLGISSPTVPVAFKW